MSHLVKDIGIGLRYLRRSPWFTAVAVITLGIGIAVNATVFTWINSVLMNPLPGAGNPEELALIETVTSRGEYLVNTSYLDYLDYRSSLTLVSGVALGRFTPLSMGADGKTTRAWAELVSANYFELLKVKPVAGRAFLPEEGRTPGGAPVAVISYGMWQSRYGGDPKILGKTVRLNRQQLTIVGVAPRGFRGSLAGVVFDVWVPVTMATAMGTGTGTLTYRGTRDETATIIRLKPGVSLEQARAEVAAMGKRLAEQYPATNRGVELTVTPLAQGHLGAQGMLREPLRILMALSVVLLLIVCANVANLLLARAVSRRKEFSLRLALGAGRSRLVSQMLIETLLLAAGGAVAGAVLLLWTGRLLPFLLPAMDVPIDLGGGINAPVFGFVALTALFAALLSGAAPALLAVRSNLHETLKEGGRSGSSGSRSHRLRGALVISEMAMVMVALIGAGLFYRSFQNAAAIQPGFDRASTSVSRFYLSNAGYSAIEQRDFCRKLRERMEPYPGVKGVTYSDVIPMSTASGAGSTPWHRLTIEGYAPAPNESMTVHRATVPPGYFQQFGIPILEGRDFTDKDSAGTPVPVIVNQTFANRYFGGRNPVGRKIRCENQETTVVGLVKDSKYHTPVEGPTPFFYVPFDQWFAPGLNFSVFLKTAGDPLALTPVLRREALALNQDAVFNTKLLSDATTDSLFAQRVAASLLAGVGAISLLLAAIGLYSVMSYAVSQRTQEVGIRMALGAQPSSVLGLMLRHGLMLTASGLLIGGVVALGAARIVGGMLVNVSPSDPTTFVAAAFFLAVIAVLASLLPAVRAMRVDPVVALRDE